MLDILRGLSGQARRLVLVRELGLVLARCRITNDLCALVWKINVLLHPFFLVR